MLEVLLLVLLWRRGGGFFSLRGVAGGPGRGTGSWYFGVSARGLLKVEGEGCNGRRVRSFCELSVCKFADHEWRVVTYAVCHATIRGSLGIAGETLEGLQPAGRERPCLLGFDQDGHAALEHVRCLFYDGLVGAD